MPETGAQLRRWVRRGVRCVLGGLAAIGLAFTNLPLLAASVVALALTTPVMFWTGWPIHRAGWLALRHRTAEMNALIILGTTTAYGYSLLVTLAPGR